MKNSEVVDSTRDGYVNYIERYLRPHLGKVAVRKIDVRALEGFYADLRRCRTRCNGKPFVEHREEGDHDCAKAKSETARLLRLNSSMPLDVEVPPPDTRN